MHGPGRIFAERTGQGRKAGFGAKRTPQKQAQNDFALFGGVKLAADRIGRKNRVIEKAAGIPEAGVYPCRFYCK